MVHQIRGSLKFVSWKDTKAVAKDLKSVYSALNEQVSLLALRDFNDIWGKKYPNASWQTHLNYLLFSNIQKQLEN
jgi:transposase-like protein